MVGSGIPSWSEWESVVEAIVNTEGRKYNVPGYDFDDIAQEIRMECYRVMEFYDPQRIGNSPYKYLITCIRNRFYNMRRGVYVPNNPPCVRCELWDKENRRCTIDEVGCDKIVRYRKGMSTKAALHKPSSLDIDVEDASIGNNVNLIVLDESIVAALPSGLIIHYQHLKSGNSTMVPPRIKRQIREITKRIIEDA
jgi:hypothetical protein